MRKGFKPLPFVKWLGGKRTQAEQIVSYFPEDGYSYFEPFLGGGAVFFEAFWREMIGGSARLSDVNGELVTAWKGVGSDFRRVLAFVEDLFVDSLEFYNRLRAFDPTEADEVFVAARMIWLNRMCFNGLYRTNKAGGFNATYAPPEKRSKGSGLVNIERVLKGAAFALAETKADLMTEPFEKALYGYEIPDPEEGDLVYLDPPYDGTFDRYASGGFGDDDQLDLRDVFARLSGDGVAVVETNSDTPLIRDLYSEIPGVFFVETRGRRSVNREGSGRRKATDLIILGGASAEIARERGEKSV